MTDTDTLETFDKMLLDDNDFIQEPDEDLDSLFYNKNKKDIQALASDLLGGKNVVFVTGAGLSVSCGISAYRGTKNAVWSNFIMEWGTRARFKEDPIGFYNTFWLQSHEKRNFLEALPNLGHYAISEICEFCNVNVITQNIDALHVKSKVPPEKLIEIHGRISLYKCINDKCAYSYEKTIDLNIDDYNSNGTSIWKDNLVLASPPLCPGCKRPALPQSLLFDEAYSSHSFYQHDRALDWIENADVFVFVGTSFSVGITDTILSTCRKSKNKKLYNFNLYKEKIAGMKSILGPSEITLPLLKNEIINQTINVAGRKLWYGGTIRRIVNEASQKNNTNNNNNNSTVRV